MTPSSERSTTTFANWAGGLTRYLKSRGEIVDQREIKMRCCFHEEKTGSLVVELSKGTFYCHGCHRGGGAVELIEALEGCTRKRAFEILSDGINASPAESRFAPEVESPAPDLPAILATAQTNLARFAGDVNWLAANGVSPAILRLYGVGIIPRRVKTPDDRWVDTFALMVPNHAGGLLSGIKKYTWRAKEIAGAGALKAMSVKGSKPRLVGGHLLGQIRAGEGTILLTGGEKDVLVAATAAAQVLPGLVAVAHAAGEGAWTAKTPVALELALELVRARSGRIVIALDVNEANRGARGAAECLLAAGATNVSVIQYPPDFARSNPTGGIHQFVSLHGVRAFAELVQGAKVHDACNEHYVDPGFRLACTWLESFRPTVKTLLAREKPKLPNHQPQPDGSPNEGETALALSGWICEARINPDLAVAVLDALGVDLPKKRVISTYAQMSKGVRVRGGRALDHLLTLAGFGKAEGKAWLGALETIQNLQLDLWLFPAPESQKRKDNRRIQRARRDLAFSKIENVEVDDPLLLEGKARAMGILHCREAEARQSCPSRSCDVERRADALGSRYRMLVPCADRACPECLPQDRGARARVAIKTARELQVAEKEQGLPPRSVRVLTVWMKPEFNDPGLYKQLFDWIHEDLHPGDGKPPMAGHVVPGVISVITYDTPAFTHYRKNETFSCDQDLTRCHLEDDEDLRARFGIAAVALSPAVDRRTGVALSFDPADRALARYYDKMWKLLPSASPDGGATEEYQQRVERFFLALGEDPWQQHRFALFRGGQEGEEARGEAAARELLPLPSKACLREQRGRDADASAGLCSGHDPNCACGQKFVWDLYNDEGTELWARGLEYFPTIKEVIELKKTRYTAHPEFNAHLRQ